MTPAVFYGIINRAKVDSENERILDPVILQLFFDR